MENNIYYRVICFLALVVVVIALLCLGLAVSSLLAVGPTFSAELLSYLRASFLIYGLLLGLQRCGKSDCRAW